MLGRYVQEKFSMFELEPQYRSYAKVFEVFRMAEVAPPIKQEDIIASELTGFAKKAELTKVPKLPEDDDLDDPDVSTFK